ncbi:MAG: hypothetical protein ACLQNG_06970 [Acidimicrobiales bacterium]
MIAVIIRLENSSSAGGGRHTTSALAGHGHADDLSSLAAEIDQFAVNVAASTGDPTPTAVSWVSSTLGPAALDISGDGFSNSTAQAIPVYALEISGTFEAATVRSKPTGTNLWLVVQQSNWLVLGTGLMKTTPSMESLGTVETDSLTDVAPTTMAAWMAKYHVAAPKCIMWNKQHRCVRRNWSSS